MAKKDTGLQYRGTCPHCFKDHAVRIGRGIGEGSMVDHGYQRPEGWHANVGSCSGVDAPHFGTPEGKRSAAGHADYIRRYAENQRKRAVELARGDFAELTIRVRKAGGRFNDYEQIQIGKNDRRYAAQQEREIHKANSNAENADKAAADIEKMVAAWEPKVARSVIVEKKQPTIHLLGSYYSRDRKSGSACAASAMGAQRSMMQIQTADRSKVTCVRCLKVLAARDERAAKNAAAQQEGN